MSIQWKWFLTTHLSILGLIIFYRSHMSNHSNVAPKYTSSRSKNFCQWNSHMLRALAVRPIFASGGAKFTKMGDSLPWTPMNRRAKYDAASIVLGGEIRNRTNKQTNTSISTACLSDVWIKCPTVRVDEGHSTVCTINSNKNKTAKNTNLIAILLLT